MVNRLLYHTKFKIVSNLGVGVGYELWVKDEGGGYLSSSRTLRKVETILGSN